MSNPKAKRKKSRESFRSVDAAGRSVLNADEVASARVQGSDEGSILAQAFEQNGEQIRALHRFQGFGVEQRIQLVHRLQRSYGNNYVQRMVEKRKPYPTEGESRLQDLGTGAALEPGVNPSQRSAGIFVQRWEAGEHERLGNEATGKRQVQLADDYSITYGEMVALAGDHFESIAQMRDFAKRDSGPNSRAEIEYAIEWKLGRPRKYDQAAKAAQESRYYALAGKNQSHFLNPEQGDKDKTLKQRNSKWNFSAGSGSFPTAGTPANAGTGYRANHLQAIDEAIEDARKGVGLARALATEAFSAHYLTDAFAGGHIRTERRSISDHWNRRVPMFNYNLKGFIAQKLAFEMQKSTYTYGPVMVRADVLYHGIPTEKGALDTISEALDSMGPFTFGDVVSGALHDVDNDAGVLVNVHFKTVDYLMRMRGDGHLTGEQETLVRDIVRASHDEVLKAHNLAMSGSQPAAIRESLQQGGLFVGEIAMPKPVSDEYQGGSKSIRWDYDTVEQLLSHDKFKKAAEVFAKSKVSELRDAAAKFGPAKADAMEKAVIEQLLANPAGVLMEIVNWTPSTGGGALGHNTDDNANDYWEQAKRAPGGLSSLTYEQRRSLIRSLLSGATVGTDEDALMDILSSAPDKDARNLISEFGWTRLHNDIDDWAGEKFAERFPKRIYGR